MEINGESGELIQIKQELITGAGHGIGKELAIAYASLGATVVCWDIHQEMNITTMNEIKQMGINSVYAYKCDVSNREEVFNVAEKVKKEVGIVTILVNNAGILIIKKFLESSKDDIDRIIDINIKAHYWTLQAFLPNMIEKNHGHIVAIASLAAFLAGKQVTIYSSTKTAVSAFMTNLEEELRLYSKGTSMIKFTTLYPSLVLTGIVKRFVMRVLIKSLILTSKKTASLIIDAQRQNLRHESIPPRWYLLVNIFRVLPAKIQYDIIKYLDFNVEE